MYRSVYVGQARWSLEVRVDMNAAALLQQTAPYSVVVPLTSFFPSFHVHEPSYLTSLYGYRSIAIDTVA